jgi:hypothetical protein
MRLKTISLADGRELAQLLLEQKISAIKKNMLIPDELLWELEEFAARNIAPHTNGRICCRCLKAYALKKAEDTCEAGHNGYCMDNGRLIRI